MGQVGQDRCKGLLEDDAHRIRIDHHNFLHLIDEERCWRWKFLNPVEGILHISRCKQIAVMEAHTLTQLELPGDFINLLPALGQPRHDLQVIAMIDQGLVDLNPHPCRRLVVLPVGIQSYRIRGLGHDERLGRS